MGLALEVPATRVLGWLSNEEPNLSGVPVGGVARNRRSTRIRIRSALHPFTDPYANRRWIMSVIIGIDPHKGSHTATAVDGGELALAEIEVQATRRQTKELLGWAERFPTRRWAIESANGHGYLLAHRRES
jgi:hypothetical protein